MGLFVIGLGLGELSDITLKGKELIEKSDIIFLESYTSILINSKLQDLEKFYNKKIFEADRETIENDEICEKLILEPSKTKNVSVLVVGDPFGATTHMDLITRARKKGINVEVAHNASIINAIGCCGLELYKVNSFKKKIKKKN
jgi:diphthine methyl ester synthase